MEGFTRLLFKLNAGRNRRFSSLMNSESSPSRHERREFLKRLGLAGAGLLLGGKTFAEGPSATVPRRTFGRHDFTVSSLCLGGHTLRKASDEDA